MRKRFFRQNVGNWGKLAYEASVKYRALQRAGGCNNLNGHILEIMGADRTNFNPFNGCREILNRSHTATAVDSFITRNGRIVHRIQYKDTPRSLGDTIRRVRSGQYNSVTLKGTTETATTFNRYAENHGMTKRMCDTGISSRTTKSLARSCGAARQITVTQAAAAAARSGGVFGGAFAGGISLITNSLAVANGEMDIADAGCIVVKDTAGGMLSGAAAGAAATVTGAGISAAMAGSAIAGTALGTVCVAAAPVAVAIGVGYGIMELWNAIWD